MGLFSAPKLTSPTPAPVAGQQVNQTVTGLQNSTANAAKLAGGFGSTILTSPQGTTQPNTTGAKTLLGS